MSYVTDNELDRLFDWSENADIELGVYDSVRGDNTTPYPPEPEDLIRLHRLIRQHRPWTVLEFGCGYSTPVIADALEKNEAEWYELNERPEIRNRFPFQLFSVDASQNWLRHVEARLPVHLKQRIHLHQSNVVIGTHNGQLCHFYDDLPDIVPDLVYLDGPHPKDVRGSYNGLTFSCDERTVMAADLLVMESTLLPGCVIHVDGRTQNARFLGRNFIRNWQIDWDRHGDVTTMRLCEERLGKYNVLGKDFFP